MGKLILLGILGFVVWWMWRKLRSPAADRQQAPAPRPAEAMVSCAHCGLNQPRSECIESDGACYCCDAHRREAEAAAKDK
ncbi:MAG TPA: PP0621 family protein [Azospira sp.]|nr:PP0621 family protein [Azospira sp.]